MYATSLTASMALVVDHAFLTRLALRSALCDDAFNHIRISYEPGGRFRLCLDNTVIVSGRLHKPQFHAFVLSTLFQARYDGP